MRMHRRVVLAVSAAALLAAACTTTLHFGVAPLDGGVEGGVEGGADAPATDAGPECDLACATVVASVYPEAIAASDKAVAWLAGGAVFGKLLDVGDGGSGPIAVFTDPPVPTGNAALRGDLVY